MADQSNERSYRLICGVFSPDEAKEVLMTLIEDKISFHRRNNWRQRDCFGETDTLGVKRIDELRQSKEGGGQRPEGDLLELIKTDID